MINSPPLQIVCGYRPSYKVDIKLHEPLWKIRLTKVQRSKELLTLMSMLEYLCTGIQDLNESNMSYQHLLPTYEANAEIVLEKIIKLIESEFNQDLKGDTDKFDEFLSRSGLGMLFPLCRAYLLDIDVTDNVTDRSIEGHYSQLTCINRVHTLCEQIGNDMFYISNHKYIAHQLSLLYAALKGAKQLAAEGSSSSVHTAIASHMGDIEARFDEVKVCLRDEGEASGSAGEGEEDEECVCVPAEDAHSGAGVSAARPQLSQKLNHWLLMLLVHIQQLMDEFTRRLIQAQAPTAAADVGPGLAQVVAHLHAY